MEHSSRDADRKLVLPGNDHVLHQWKIKSGSSVRRGETVALAIPRNRTKRSRSTTTIVSNTTAATTAASAPPSEQHKRPKKRKRGGSSSSAPSESSSSTSNTTTEDDKVKAVNQTSNKNSQAAITVVQQEATVPIVAPADGLLRILELNEENDQQIGWIEECSHPAIMGGLCAVCGHKVVQDDGGGGDSSKQATSSVSTSLSSLVSKVTKQQQQVTVSGGITVTVSEQEAQHMARQTSKRLLQQRKLSLVLDLDHTLVHATADPRAQAFVDHNNNNSTVSHVRTLLLPLMENPTLPQQPQYLVKHFVKLRPHVKEFLEKALDLYEVTVYTAGTRLYAVQITMVLCRHMVGTSMDQEDLEKLRYELHVAQHQLQHRQQEQATEQPNDEEEDETETKPSSSADQQQQQQTDTTSDKQQQPQQDKKPVENGTLDDDNTAENGTSTTQPKKKRVSFGEPPPSTRTDKDTLVELQEKINQLQQQLQEAERLEASAMELRQRLFGSRIVSRTDVGDLGKDVKSLKRIFPCGGTMAAIVDDREDVWAKAGDNAITVRKGEPPENLLLVRPYHWKPFLGFADVNNPSGKVDMGGVGETNNNNNDETDVQLLWTSDILQRLHERFYARDLTAEQQQQSMSVPQVLRDMRKDVLKGSRIVLSGLVPLHKQQQQREWDSSSSSPRPSVIRHAESLGAKILDKVMIAGEKVKRSKLPTHVVAARDGTDKILQARKIHHCAVVKASWLMECVWSVTRRDEASHLLGPPGVAPSSSAPPSTSNNMILLSGSDSSEDDEDFAAELEGQMMEE